MSKFDIFILLLTIAAVALFIYMIWEALAGTRAARHRQQPRKLYATYGAGYFIGWEEEWEWENVPPPFRMRVRRATRAMERFSFSMGVVLGPAMRRAIDSFTELQARLSDKHTGNGQGPQAVQCK